MTNIKRFFDWLFSVPDAQRTPATALVWWELRRIPYNILVGVVGIASLAVFLGSIFSANVLGPGEDAVEPLALLAAPIAINICYTAGWLGESVLWVFWPDKRQFFGPLLFKLGLGFSLFVVTLPAIFWGGFRLLQLMGFKLSAA